MSDEPRSVSLDYTDGVPTWRVTVPDAAQMRAVGTKFLTRAFCLPEGALVAHGFWLYDQPSRPYYLTRVLDASDPNVAVYLERSRDKRFWIIELSDTMPGKPGCLRVASLEGTGFDDACKAALDHNDALGERRNGARALDHYLSLFTGPAKESGVEAGWEAVARACQDDAERPLSAGARWIDAMAEREARSTFHRELRAEHLWVALCQLGDAVPSFPPEEQLAVADEAAALTRWFESRRLDPAAFRRALQRKLGHGTVKPKDNETMKISAAVIRAWTRARFLARVETSSAVLAVHLKRALLEDPADLVGDLLGKAGLAVTAPAPESKASAAPPEAGADPLPQFGRDLTALAREGRLDAVIGRKDEIRQLGQVLSQKKKPNAILVGDAGVGKTCIVEGLAGKIVQPSAPEPLAGRRIIELSMSALVAGARYRGEFEQRLQAIIRKAEEDPNLILFIDEIHTVLGAGEAEGSLDAANILKPALARGRMRVIGATTTEEYERYVARDPAFERRFDIVWVEEPSRSETVEILKGLRPGFEEHHRVGISDEALEAAVDLSLRFLPGRRLPDKAVDLLDQACAQAVLKSISSRPRDAAPTPILAREDIARGVASRVRIPAEMLVQSQADRMARMESILGIRVLGQPDAVRAVAAAVRASAAGLNDGRRPIASFLFVGPPGVGKTELARALSEFLFLEEDRLIQLDMSEFAEPHTVSKLIGAPPGYVGFGQEGQLTGPIRRRPSAVVVLDEIEKAHPEVLNVLLQVLDEGRLTDGRGRRVSFREAVIVLTSNLGATSEPAPAPIGFASREPRPEKEDDRRMLDAVAAHLRPELRNRLSATIVFQPLSMALLETLVERKVEALAKSLSDRGVRVELDPAARTLLATRGDGARGIARAVEREVSQPVADLLLSGKLPPGSRVGVAARGAAVQVTVERDPH